MWHKIAAKPQLPQFPAEIQQQIGVLNMRIANVNLANVDLLHEMDTTFKQLLAQISKLEQENAELKNKHKECCKKTKTT